MARRIPPVRARFVGRYKKYLSRLLSHRQILSDGETGYLIDPDNAAILAERIAFLSKDRDLLTRMSVKALERYRQQPTWDKTARHIQEFLLGILKNPAVIF